jgi:hypothetical protein
MAFAVPAQASAATFKGTAVHRDARLHAWVVAGRGGALRLVHTSAKLHAGSVVTVRGKLLADRSLSASAVAVRGAAHRVRIRGTVVRHTRHSLTIAARGAVVTVRNAHARRLASALDTTTPPTQPTDGTTVVVTASVNPSSGELDEQDVQEQSSQSGGVELSGAVQQPSTSCPAPMLSVQLDDGQGIVCITVPAGMDVSSLTPGTAGEFRVTIAAGTTPGSNTLTLVSFKSEDQGDGEDDHGGQSQSDHGGQGQSDNGDQGANTNASGSTSGATGGRD